MINSLSSISRALLRDIPSSKAPSPITDIALPLIRRMSVSTDARITPSSKIISGPVLTHEMLSAVVSGRALACAIDGFTDQKTCQTLTHRLLNESNYEYYGYAKGSVGRVGFSFSEIVSPETHKKYYSEARASIDFIRALCGNIPSPIDQFRLKLQEAWKYGANFEMLHPDEQMFVGLCRVIEANKSILPHQDMISWYDKHSEASMKILKQLTMNIYLQVPETGGDLELWSWGFKDQKDYQALAGDSYGIEKSKLPPPDLVIKPKEGQLIIFNPGNLHCIATGSAPRLTMSSFLGYHGEKKPLTWWS